MFNKSMGSFMVYDVVHWEMSNYKLKGNKRFYRVFVVVVVLKIHALIFSTHFKIMSRHPRLQYVCMYHVCNSKLGRHTYTLYIVPGWQVTAMQCIVLVLLTWEQAQNRKFNWFGKLFWSSTQFCQPISSPDIF